MRALKLCLITLFALTLALPTVLLAAGDTGGMVLGVSPTSVQISSTYDGLPLTITGKAPVGSDILVRFLGGRGEMHMKEKGRVLGLLWMNLGSLTLKEVPSVCLVTASRDLDELGATASAYRLDRVAQDIVITPADKDTAVNRQELLKLKSGEGLYREVQNGVTLGATDGVVQGFKAVLPVPSRLAPGDYTIEVIALKDGAVVASGTSSMHAELTGVPALMADVAFNHSLLYGILATVVALLAGLAIGLVFQSKGAH